MMALTILSLSSSIPTSLSGGFLALEEIDESEYVEIPKIEVGNVKKRAVVSLLLQHQFEELARQKIYGQSNIVQNKRQLVVIGQDCVDPLQALRSASREASLDLKEIAEKHKSMGKLRKKRKEMKTHISSFLLASLYPPARYARAKTKAEEQFLM